MKRKKVQKNSEIENKNTTSRLFAVQALFQMEAVGKSFNQIKKEIKEKLQREQFEDSTIIKPNYSLCEKIIEGASFNQRQGRFVHVVFSNTLDYYHNHPCACKHNQEIVSHQVLHNR